jgi:hypothetical protein
MPMIDVCAPDDLFPAGANRHLAKELTSALLRAEGTLLHRAVRHAWVPIRQGERLSRWSFCCEWWHLGDLSERYLPQPHSAPREI